MQESAQHTLEYLPAHRRSDSSATAAFIFVLPLLVAAVLAIVGAQDFALLGAAATALFMWIRMRRRRNRPEAVLRIENGRLRAYGADSHELLNIALDQLDDVTLDTRTIQRVQENLRSGMPDIRFIDSTVRPESDISRIELKTPDASVFLSEEHFSSSDTTEWLGTIRRFLRANGWAPQGEREAGPGTQESHD
jgi:hypothetical protein